MPLSLRQPPSARKVKGALRAYLRVFCRNLGDDANRVSFDLLSPGSFSLKLCIRSEGHFRAFLTQRVRGPNLFRSPNRLTCGGA